MAARINIVTLGVEDLCKSEAFYRALGFVLSESSCNDQIRFFQAGGVVLSLFGREALIDDACLKNAQPSPGGIALAYNLESEEAVDQFLATAFAAGARELRPADKTYWGGYSGCFADPDGHVWEVAHNPFISFKDDGTLDLQI